MRALTPKHCLTRRSTFLVALVFLSACASTANHAQTWLRTELYLGLSRHNAPDIAPAQFQAFLDSEVTPRFPDGYTVVDAQGRWRDSAGRIVTEPSRVIILLHPEDADADRKIDEIRDAYKHEFDQESVLRVDDRERVEF